MQAVLNELVEGVLDLVGAPLRRDLKSNPVRPIPQVNRWVVWADSVHHFELQVVRNIKHTAEERLCLQVVVEKLQLPLRFQRHLDPRKPLRDRPEGIDALKDHVATPNPCRWDVQDNYEIRYRGDPDKFVASFRSN